MLAFYGDQQEGVKPTFWDQFQPSGSHDDSSHTQIINPGTINYGAVHYDYFVNFNYPSSDQQFLTTEFT